MTTVAEEVHRDLVVGTSFPFLQFNESGCSYQQTSTDIIRKGSWLTEEKELVPNIAGFWTGVVGLD